MNDPNKLFEEYLKQYEFPSSWIITEEGKRAVTNTLDYQWFVFKEACLEFGRTIRDNIKWPTFRGTRK